MRAPSFRCTERPEDGALILHYYSERPGLEHIVIGIVKTVASRLHDTGQYRPCTMKKAFVMTSFHDIEVDVTVVKEKGEDEDHVQFAITERRKSDDLTTKADQSDGTLEIDNMSLENRISPLTFSKAFPFHLVFDRNLKICQVIVRRKWSVSLRKAVHQ